MTETIRAVEGLIHDFKQLKFLDAIGDGISIQDTSYRVLYQNNVHKKFVGDHLGAYCYKAYEKRDSVCEGCPVETALSDGGIHMSERIVKSETGLSYFEITASPIRDSGGRIIAAIESVRDITEHKETDRQLQKAVHEWQHTFDAIADFVSVHDKDFRFVKVNRALADFLQIDPEDIIGKHCYKVLHNTDEHWPGCPHSRMLEMKKTMTAEVNDPNIGRILHVSVSPIYGDKGEFIGGVHIAKDITEQKKTEGKLKIMDQAVKSSANAIALADLNANLTYVNHSFLKMWGFDDETKVLGRPCIDFWLEKDMTAIIMSSLVENGSWSGERTAVRRDGSVFIADLSANMVVDDSGKPVCLMALISDISERKKMEDEIRERVAELENFYNMAVNREIKMKELKEEIISLKSELERIR